MAVTIRRLDPADLELVLAAGNLFDAPPDRSATIRFLAAEGHHLFMALEEGVALGFVTGVEMTHPDKGTEMFLYELAVDDGARRRGIGSALVGALRDLARERGCYDMWVLTDHDNDAALATYRRSGSVAEVTTVMLEWPLADDA